MFHRKQGSIPQLLTILTTAFPGNQQLFSMVIAFVWY